MHAVSPTLYIRLPDEVPPKQQSRCNLLFVEMLNDFIAGKRCGFAHREEEAEPGWLAFRRRLRKNEELLKAPQPIFQMLVIVAARFDEAIEMAELRHSDRRLHVRDL